MRAFLIKYLFGRYWWKLPWQSRYNSTDRGAFWNFNGFLLIAILFLITRSELIISLSIPWALQVLYFGFDLRGYGYFSRYPVKWKELDDEQKWYYGQAAMSGQLTKRLKFSSYQMSEWMGINNRFKDKYNLRK